MKKQQIYIQSIHPTYHLPYWYCPATSESIWTYPFSTDKNVEVIVLDTVTIEDYLQRKNNSSTTTITATNHQHGKDNNNATVIPMNTVSQPSSYPVHTSPHQIIPYISSQMNDGVDVLVPTPLKETVVPTTTVSILPQSSSPIPSNSNTNTKPSVSSSPISLPNTSTTSTNGWTLLPSSTLKTVSVPSTEGTNTPTTTTHASSNDNNYNFNTESLQQRYGWDDNLVHTALIPDNHPYLVSSSPLEGVAAALVTASNGNDKAFTTVKKVLSRLAYHPEIGTLERTSSFINTTNNNNNSNGSSNTPQPSVNASPISTSDTNNNQTSNTNTNDRLSAVAVYEMMEQFLSPFETDDIELLSKTSIHNNKKSDIISINNNSNAIIESETTTDLTSTTPDKQRLSSSSALSEIAPIVIPTQSQPTIPLVSSSNVSTPSKGGRSPSLLMMDPQLLPPDSVRALSALLYPSTDGYSFLKKTKHINGSSYSNSNSSSVTPSNNFRTSSPLGNNSYHFNQPPPLLLSSSSSSPFGTYPIPVRSLPTPMTTKVAKDSSSPTIVTNVSPSTASGPGSAVGSLAKEKKDILGSRSSSIASSTGILSHLGSKDPYGAMHPPSSTTTTAALQNTFRPIDYETNPFMHIVPANENSTNNDNNNRQQQQQQTDFIRAIQQEIIDERNYQNYQVQLLQQKMNNGTSLSSTVSAKVSTPKTTSTIGLAFQDHPSDHITTTLLPFDPSTQSAIPISLALLHKHATESIPLEHTLSVIKKPIHSDFPLLSIAPSLSSLMNSSSVPSMVPAITIISPSRTNASSSSSSLPLSPSSSSSSSVSSSPHSNRFHLQSGNNTVSAFSPPRSPVNGQSMNNSNNNYGESINPITSLSRNNTTTYPTNPTRSSSYSYASAPAPASPVSSVLSESFPLTAVPEESIEREERLVTEPSIPLKSIIISPSSSVPYIPPPQAPPLLNSKLLLPTTLSTAYQGININYNGSISNNYNHHRKEESGKEDYGSSNKNTFTTTNRSDEEEEDSSRQQRPGTPPFPPLALGTTLMDATTDKIRQGIIDPWYPPSLPYPPIPHASTVVPNDNLAFLSSSTSSSAPLTTTTLLYNNLPMILPTTISPVDEHLLLPSIVQLKHSPPSKIITDDDDGGNEDGNANRTLGSINSTKTKKEQQSQQPSFVTTSKSMHTSPTSNKNSSKNELLMNVLDAIIDVQQTTHYYGSASASSLSDRISSSSLLINHPSSASSSSTFGKGKESTALANAPPPVTTLYTKQMPKVPVMTQLLARIALG